MDIENLRSILRDYYGRHLKSKSDLSQNACCTGETQKRYKQILDLLPADVKEKHYGCGCPVPQDDLKGLTALDLGSGAGVDAFILSSLVGPTGFVYGIDMTEEQLSIANRAIPFVMDRFRFDRPNVQFNKDFIEVAESIPDQSIDLIISDCVINLSPRKDLVFKTIQRVLKEGGEFYISDIAADRRVPEKIRNNPQLIAECLGGAEYEHDWFDMMKESGFADPRTVSKIEVQRDLLDEPIVFYSMTVRGFKFSEPLDRRCEDYGQVAVYRGSIRDCPARYLFDDHHAFEANRPVPVCRNTARMLSETRLARHFEVSAPIRHFGLFACGTVAMPAANVNCC